MFFSNFYSGVAGYISSGYQMAKSVIKQTYNSVRFVTDAIGFGIRTAQEIVNAIQDIPIIQQNLPEFVTPSIDYALNVVDTIDQVMYQDLPRIGAMMDTAITDLFSLLQIPVGA